jgi:glyoxylase-like metal-dependent hydrolase (beta-lactamase superfamily II)
VQGGYMTNHFEVPVSYRPLDGDEEVAPGVRVLATHGHTPGHQSLSVTLADREVVLCADAAYTYDTLERRLLSGNIWDAARTLASLERLRNLAASGATVLPGHEPSLWARLGQPPVRFR